MEPLTGFLDHFRSVFPDVVGGRVLVAVSGGPDSIALLHLLTDPALELELEAAYVHHGTRGAEADREVDLCRRLCDELDVPFHLLMLDPQPGPRQGREASWRELRYRSLVALARERGIPAVATGHQRDDIAEGVVMQLLRGSGPRALAGIAPRTDDGVIRPLLPWSRQTIGQWLRAHQIPWCDDSSNRSLEHLRNRVRHHILPQLEETSPALRDHLVALAAALAEDDALLTVQLIKRASWIDPWSPDGGVSREAIAALPKPLRTRWLHAQAERSGIGRVSRSQLALLDGLLDHGRPRAVSLADRWRLRLVAGTLWLEPPQPPPPYRFDLRVSPTVRLPLPGWVVRLGPSGTGERDVRWRWAAPDEMPIVVRSPRPEDVIAVQESVQKLRPIMARALPRHLRGAWPVVCVDATISWIPGVWQRAVSGESGSLVVEVSRE